MTKTLTNLRLVKIREIDLERAREHFDLPIDELFHTKRDLQQALSDTKAELLQLFSDRGFIPVWRGLACDEEWATGVQRGDDLGKSWAWNIEGAIKGSGLGADADRGIIIEGSIDEAYVDWGLTIAVNTFHPDEREIVIAEPTEVNLTRAICWPARDLVRDFEERAPAP